MSDRSSAVLARDTADPICFPLAFRSLSPAAAHEVVVWRYGPPHDFYDTPADERAAEAARLSDPAGGYFAAFDAAVG